MWALVSCEFKKDLEVWLFRLLSDTVHTRGESPQDELKYMWTCEMILVLAYMLYHLSVA